MDSPATTVGAPDAETVVAKAEGQESSPTESANSDVLVEVERLKALAAEREFAERELAERYAQLEEQHQHTLDVVEELKTEVAKAQAATTEAQSPKGNTPVIRRKSSQNVMIIDRAHRSFASLRNIAAENFEDQPDVMQNFELNLNSAMHELHSRSERIQELEADVTTAKKEMETKMTIISGLTRERSSLKATSPMDMAMVSNLREQLEQSERRIREMQAAHSAREKELEAQLAELQESLKQATLAAEKTPASTEAVVEPQDSVRQAPVDSDGSATDVKEVAEMQESLKRANLAAEESAESARVASEESAAQIELREKKISELTSELSGWEDRHSTALQSMRDAEAQMAKTIGELETQLASVSEQLAETGQKKPEEEEALKEAEAKHKSLVDFLRSEIDEYKGLINSNQSKVTEVEQQHMATKKLLEMATHDRDEATSELEARKELVAKLEAQIADHEQALKAHQESLGELESKHARDVEEMTSSSKQDVESQLVTLKSEHAGRISKLEGDLTEAREDLMKVATQVAFALGLDVSVERISERLEELVSYQKALLQEQEKRAELENHVVDLSNINDTVMRDLETVKASLAEVLEAESAKAQSAYPIEEQVALVKKKVVDLESKNKKNSRLVEELEDQLQNNYDQAQMASNRLSTLQMERNVQLEEANAAKIKLQGELDAIREEYTSLQVKLEGMHSAAGLPERSDSLTGQVRKSSSVASLPSPPPAIPLPPLPNGSGANPGTTSPTPRPPSKDIGGTSAAASVGIIQIQEDQEARIRLIEKHLKAEKQLTATLEEALTDLERQQNTIRAECDAWRRRGDELEAELKELRDKPEQEHRYSMQQVEEERRKRRDAEIARAHLEERMNTIAKKKKKGSLNCF
ncbi:uncharacterized protein B0H64DRAFT_403819 [Chaetomium fimeti]|uniref:Uncharacterized protein n=1 Tax=Chaetomium fimeti TaxID=1854472 RepID=A0AAE0LQ72_9PEZI|nr:hypothetical protein B0H64DRAFT_403819 [Chaetomium fimeti]